MRRVAQHVAALAQGVQNQREVELLEIAHAAMNQLGAAARSSLAEIEALDQQSAITARGGLDRRAQTGCAPADHQHIPGLRLTAQPDQ